MKKVAYLLGAGASANALPVANQIQVYLESFLALIQRKENELDNSKYFPSEDSNTKSMKFLQSEISSNLEYLIEKISITEINFVDSTQRFEKNPEKKSDNTKSVTFDDIAMNSIFEGNYVKLATTYCLMMSYYEYLSDVDGRYINFINNITNELKVIKPNIKILNWNYDNQLPKAITHLKKEYDFFDAYENLNTVERQTKNPPDKGGLFRLNGSFNYSCKGLRVVCKPFLEYNSISKKKAIIELVRLYGMCVYNNYYNLLCLNNDKLKTKSKELAIEQIKDAEYLVIIGYSFSVINVSTDADLLNSMKNLKKVFIQDLDPAGVERAFKELYLIHGEVEFEHINPSSFYIPRDAIV